MNDIGALELGHILCLVYWLGADLGVFYSSYFVADERLSAAARLSMAKLLFALDLAPRVCMPLIFAFGAHLAWRLGAWPAAAGHVILVWIVCGLWLAMVLALHHLERGQAALARIDLGFRVAVVVLLAAYAVSALRMQILADWLAVKLLVFAGLVACGLAIRLSLKPFGPAFAALAAGTHTAEDDRAIRLAFARTRPFVVVIWIGLLANSALGVHLI